MWNDAAFVCGVLAACGLLGMLADGLGWNAKSVMFKMLTPILLPYIWFGRLLDKLPSSDDIWFAFFAAFVWIVAIAAAVRLVLWAL